MRTTEIHALGELIGDGLAAGGALVAEMHEGIAGRPFGSLGPAAAPVRLIHDGVSDAVYTGVRSGLRGLARGCARVAAQQAPADDHPLSGGIRGSLILGALNGLYGHHLAQRNSELALEMELRCRGATVPVRRAELQSTFPTAAARVVVFVHGLCETDESWRLLPLRGERSRRRDYGERLAADLDFTPVYLRYNTGLRVSDNGRRMAEILEALVTEWPVEPRELVLVGHSMGGLVARSACRYGEHQRACFTDLVKHVFCLGTPHLGADLEKGVNALGHALGRLPETRGLAKLLNARSVGIKDLRFGSCVEEDWRDHDPDEFLRDRCGEVPFLPNANYYFIAATLSHGPAGALLGDLLVRLPSASGAGGGRGRRIPFEVDNGLELTGLTHFDLLNHPDVYGQLREWIARGSAPVPGTACRPRPVSQA